MAADIASRIAIPIGQHSHQEETRFIETYAIGEEAEHFVEDTRGPIVSGIGRRTTGMSSSRCSTRTSSQSCMDSRQHSRGRLLSSISSGNSTWFHDQKRPVRTPSQERWIKHLRYDEVLDWIGSLPIPRVNVNRPIRPEMLQDGNLLWDIAIHILRPDLRNNSNIEHVENVLTQLDGAKDGATMAYDIPQKCILLHDLGRSYHQMGLYGSAVEVHSTQLQIASAVDSGGNMEFMQEALRDLGDVFRTLGEKEAQTVNRYTLGIPSKTPKSSLEVRSLTSGGLNPWPTTPVKSGYNGFPFPKIAAVVATHDLERPSKPEKEPKKENDVGSLKKEGENRKSNKKGPKTTEDCYKQRYSYEASVFSKPDISKMQDLGIKFQPGTSISRISTGIAEKPFTSVRRLSDIFNLIHECNGVQVPEIWPFRPYEDIRLGKFTDMLSCAPASASMKHANIALTDSRAKDKDDVSYSGKNDEAQLEVLPSPRTTLHDAYRRHPEDSDTSDDDRAISAQSPDHPEMIFQNMSEMPGKVVLSSDEAMWIAWYLCSLVGKIQSPDPKRDGIFRGSSTPEIVEKILEVDRKPQPKSLPRAFSNNAEISPPEVFISAPITDFESRFGHLRKTMETVNVPMTQPWDKNALAFVDTKRLKSSKYIKGNYSDFSRKLSTSPINPAGPTLVSASPARGSVAIPHRPQSRQLPAERWDSLALTGIESNLPANSKKKKSDAGQVLVVTLVSKKPTTGSWTVVNPPQPFSGKPNERSKSRKSEISPPKSCPTSFYRESKIRQFSNDLFVTGPETNDGIAERVLMSDTFSWQKLEAVKVSNMSACGNYGIITLVSGSRVGVFATSPFKRVAEVHCKDASFTCAVGTVEISFVRQVFKMNAVPSRTLCVNIPEAKNLPSDDDNFIVAGDISGCVIIASARTGVTRHTIVEAREDLGAVMMLKLFGEGSSGSLSLVLCPQARHNNAVEYAGTVIQGSPSIIWRTQACGNGLSLTGIFALRSCLVTCDDESSLRIWTIRQQRSSIAGNNSVLPHEALHQQTKISCFTGYQDNAAGSSPMIVSGSRDGTVQVWGSEGRLNKDTPLLLFGHTKAINCLFAASLRIICSGSADKTCRVWDPQATKCILTLSGHKTPVANVWCDDNQILCAESDGNLRIWSYTGCCICILECNMHEESLAARPIEMLVFQKPLTFATLDLKGSVTVWCREDDTHAPSRFDKSPFEDKWRDSAMPPKSTARPALINPKTSDPTKQTPPRSMTSQILTFSDATDGHAMSQPSSPQPLVSFHPRRRGTWWGSREERISQLWPTGRPWDSIIKKTQERPAGVKSRENTPEKAYRDSRRIKSITPDLGRNTNPMPFSPPNILPKVPGRTHYDKNYPIWMGAGRFMPEVPPQHYPGEPRRTRSPKSRVSLESSRQALVQEQIEQLHELKQLLRIGTSDYAVTSEQLEFLKGKTPNVNANELNFSLGYKDSHKNSYR